MNSNMVRVIEYINNKKYIRNTKTGRWWRVPKRGRERSKSRGERRKVKGERTRRHLS